MRIGALVLAMLICSLPKITQACETDMDCEGERVCNEGVCDDPAQKPTPQSAVPEVASTVDSAKEEAATSGDTQAADDPSPEGKEWFALVNGQRSGPFTAAEIYAKIREGLIKKRIALDNGDMDQWVLAGDAFKAEFKKVDAAKIEKQAKLAVDVGDSSYTPSLIKGKNGLFFGGKKVKNRFELSRIFREHGNDAARNKYAAVSFLFGTGYVLALVGGGFLGYGLGMAIFEGFHSTVNTLMIVGGSLAITGIIFAASSGGLLKKAIARFNNKSPQDIRVSLLPVFSPNNSGLMLNVSF